MLKQGPTFVLGLQPSSTYPRGYVSGATSPAALLEDVLSSLLAVEKIYPKRRTVSSFRFAKGLL